MIIGAITAIAILFGGSLFSFDYIRDAAEEVINDKNRAKHVVSITKQADKDYKTFTKNVDKLSKEFVLVNKDFNVTREQIDILSLQAKVNRSTFLWQSIALRFQIKNLVTEEEWNAMQNKDS